MPKGKGSNMLGAWAFLIGILLAVIFGFFAVGPWFGWLLFILGVIVGLLNIGDKETQPFLLAGAVLVIVSSLGGSAFETLKYVPTILKNILGLFVPATIIVALKTVFSMAHN
jgi:polyferredoxin